MKYHLLGQRPSLEVSVTSVGVVCVTVSPEENFSHLVCNLVGGESRKQSIHGLNSCKCQFVSVTPSITDKTGQKPQLWLICDLTKHVGNKHIRPLTNEQSENSE